MTDTRPSDRYRCGACPMTVGLTAHPDTEQYVLEPHANPLLDSTCVQSYSLPDSPETHALFRPFANTRPDTRAETLLEQTLLQAAATTATPGVFTPQEALRTLLEVFRADVETRYLWTTEAGPGVIMDNPPASQHLYACTTIRRVRLTGWTWADQDGRTTPAHD